MITTIFVLGIIFVTLGLTALSFCTIMVFSSENGNWFWSWVPFVIFIIVGIAMISETPRESDVLNGKAHYVEVYHTYDNDTIKTYHLNWDNKPGVAGSHR